MSVVTGFDSGAPSEQTEEAQVAQVDYRKVFEAIPHSLEVAENVLARNAKQDFRDNIRGKVVRKTLDYVDHSSISHLASSQQRGLERGRLGGLPDRQRN